ncbi:SidA/IucD/PvdA family monooxygenase [Pseudomonas fuscovaginae UPB0736]|uniref:lysine N(6)-hydroxylase/L-ornithine N(5)-oxygenase family protein n=1 Tax=Pseudomonas asplenii TaxID=53407 RepID=UPI000287C0D8|nr:SidA/IucD/PvdA family monooxygenase [Pseudomonas fuscovaginae]UUQ65727.1 SidA/IucD/PvdA family monooxygenase [Pseudomonas fuscovaginae UPB0736]
MKTYDLIGIGIGPFNLSLAALAEPTGLQTLFLDKRDTFAWHPGMLLSNGQLQVSPLKDCVTLASPTSRYSFLNYLAEHRRLYSFINKGGASTSRKEFADYYGWVARQLSNLRFAQEVLDVVESAEGYTVITAEQSYQARAVVIGVGITPRVPECARPWLGNSIYHVADFLHREAIQPGEQVLVVGGGQSGAEAVEQLLGNPSMGALTWVTSRSNLFAMDDNAFVNEAFCPAYNQRFQTLPMAQRSHAVQQERLTSDGISADLCNRLYEQLYERHVGHEQRQAIDILQSAVLDGLEPEGRRWRARLRSLSSGRQRTIVVDRVILATGFQPCPQPYVDTLLANAQRDGGQPLIDGSYRVQFATPMPGPVYLQNRSIVQHGLQSVNLSMVAYRNSRILNDLLGYEHFQAEPDTPMFSHIDALTDTPARQMEPRHALSLVQF